MWSEENDDIKIWNSLSHVKQHFIEALLLRDPGHDQSRGTASGTVLEQPRDLRSGKYPALVPRKGLSAVVSMPHAALPPGDWRGLRVGCAARPDPAPGDCAGDRWLAI